VPDKLVVLLRPSRITGHESPSKRRIARNGIAARSRLTGSRSIRRGATPEINQTGTVWYAPNDFTRPERTPDFRRPAAPHDRYRSDGDRGDGAIELIGRDDHARTGLGSLRARGWIEANQEDAEPLDHHCHCFTSNSLVMRRVVARSSGARGGRRNAFDQLARALRRGRSNKPFPDVSTSKPYGQWFKVNSAAVVFMRAFSVAEWA